MAGMDVVIVNCDENGNIDVADLKAKAEAHKDELAALMITYPSTHGVFEPTIEEICSIVHANGDPGFDDLKSWFYDTLSGVASSPDDEYRKAFRKFLDSPHRVIIETEANLVVAFDTVKFAAFTNEAIAAGQA